MKKLSQDEMMRFIDGTLEESRRLEVEQYVNNNAEAEDVQLLQEMQFAMSALHDWDQSEPVRASEDFWPKLREQLPEKPDQGLWRSSLQSLSDALFPRRSVWQLSARAAAIAVVVAMALSFFGPKNATQSVQADWKPSAAEQQFIQQSLTSHRAYEAVQPPVGIVITPGDGRNQDGDDTGDDTDTEYIP